jgi:hypothetical protein
MYEIVHTVLIYRVAPRPDLVEIVREVGKNWGGAVV